MKPAALLLPLALLGLVACEPKTATAIYAPHEVGLTLAFENPQVPAEQRRDQRLQVRVSRVTATPTGGWQVEQSYTTLHGEVFSTFLLEGGGVTLAGPDGRIIGELIPKGFPDRSQEWVVRGRRFRVLGRATATGLAVALPQDASQVGVWVESTPLEGHGLRTRTLFLPDLGEVETQEFRTGQWVIVNKLVSRGFTDAPTHRSESGS